MNIIPAPGTPMMTVAEILSKNIEKHFPSEESPMRQTLAICEEVGELVKEHRRYCGMSRKAGDIDNLYGELSDVVITSYVTAYVFGINLDEFLSVLTNPIVDLNRNSIILRMVHHSGEIASIIDQQDSIFIEIIRIPLLGVNLGYLVNYARLYAQYLSPDRALIDEINKKLYHIDTGIFSRGWKNW